MPEKGQQKSRLLPAVYAVLCAGHVSGTKAAGADIHSLYLAVDDNTYSLNVRLPGSFRLQVGMGYVHTSGGLLSAYFAIIRHVLHLLALP